MTPFIGINGEDQIIVYMPGRQYAMTKDEALDFAVKLVAVTDDPREPKFGKKLREFLET